jgi:hypothetical protein
VSDEELGRLASPFKRMEHSIRFLTGLANRLWKSRSFGLRSSSVDRDRIRFIQTLTDLCLVLLVQLCDIDLYTYQTEMADRILFSLLIGDSEEITIECARQAGKSETLADVAATSMVIFPKLAALYPDDPVLKKFKNGIEIGCFAPIDDQADTIFGRVETRLTSRAAQLFLADPEINTIVIKSGSEIKTDSGSICRRQTAHAKAKIESKTYHLAIIDEAQDADSTKVRRSIHPMMTATAGSILKVGTPGYSKSDYYEACQRNRHRRPVNGKRNHFCFDWKRAARENPYYAQAIEKEKQRLGEDSDEFRTSYCCVWLLERGMFITEERIEELGDKTMEIVPYWNDSPIVIGIDVAKKHDSTVCTALWVDWEHPDNFGFYNHRILAWLELRGENWESQYREICDFADRYYVARIGVDSQGMGDPVAERLGVLLPNIEVVPMAMNPIDQSERWTHLMQLIQKGFIGWPAHPRTRRLQVYKRFCHQMSEVEKEYRGKYLLVSAPKNEKNAHDDFIDSLALAASLTKDFGQNLEVEEWSVNPFVQGHPLRAG